MTLIVCQFMIILLSCGRIKERSFLRKTTKKFQSTFVKITKQSNLWLLCRKKWLEIRKLLSFTISQKLWEMAMHHLFSWKMRCICHQTAALQGWEIWIAIAHCSIIRPFFRWTLDTNKIWKFWIHLQIPKCEFSKGAHSKAKGLSITQAIFSLSTQLALL